MFFEMAVLIRDRVFREEGGCDIMSISAMLIEHINYLCVSGEPA